mgnify:CR=1 FL=1
MKKIVVLDTDISNEIDDQFALVYLMKSLSEVDVQAITIAPFKKSSFMPVETIGEGTDLSFNTAIKILDMLGLEKYKKKVLKGAKHYFFESRELNPASKKIIELARRFEHITVIAIGAITNVALALYHAPDIATKIDVVWLGGHSFLQDKNDEYNFRQDVDAVRFVFNSEVSLTVIPCKNVASYLQTTIFELEHYLKDGGEIGKYLREIFKNCKKHRHKNESDKIGESKVLWDMSAVAFCLNQSWFGYKEISCPEILEDLSYKQTKGRHKVTFANFVDRQAVFKDFFMKMGL